MTSSRPRPFRFSVQGFEATSGKQWTDLARKADRTGSHERRAAALQRQAREFLGVHAKSSAAALSASPLTSRETEVAQLAARGLSDRNIADELVLSIRTVQSHLASAYRKLGINSRRQLATLLSAE